MNNYYDVILIFLLGINILTPNQYILLHTDRKRRQLSVICKVNVQCLLILCQSAKHKICYTLLLKNIGHYFVPQQVFLRSFPPVLFLSSYASFHIFISERDCTPLKCFLQRLQKSNHQLALSRLMNSIHYSSAIQ
jgi:hypothetical protein